MKDLGDELLCAGLQGSLIGADEFVAVDKKIEVMQDVARAVLFRLGRNGYMSSLENKGPMECSPIHRSR